MSLRIITGVVLVFEHRANRSRVSHEVTETRSLG